MKLISPQFDNASWRSFLIVFALWAAYNFYAFSPDGPWAAALAERGGKLPETLPGFPAIEPQRTLAVMESGGAWLIWQAWDIPYIVFNALVAGFGMALGLKAVRREHSFLRAALILPAVYVACEAVENALLALFASRIVAATEIPVLIQQLATTLKLGSGGAAMIVGFLGLAVALGVGAVRLMRKRTT